MSQYLLVAVENLPREGLENLFSYIAHAAYCKGDVAGHNEAVMEH